jgi:hypothetical protein
MFLGAVSARTARINQSGKGPDMVAVVVDKDGINQKRGDEQVREQREGCSACHGSAAQRSARIEMPRGLL